MSSPRSPQTDTSHATVAAASSSEAPSSDDRRPGARALPALPIGAFRALRTSRKTLENARWLAQLADRAGLETASEVIHEIDAALAEVRDALARG